MEEMSLLIAQNLKRIRDERNLSLDKLAELTGVSKSMLGQIERGESSPTVATLWKISNGLKLSFTTLLNKPQSDTDVIRKENITALLEDNGKYRLYPFFPLEDGKQFEIYMIEIDGGGSLSAERFLRRINRARGRRRLPGQRRQRHPLPRRPPARLP
jgi:XRE family transcriptional regulator, regulator of sulfur utilization